MSDFENPIDGGADRPAEVPKWPFIFGDVLLVSSSLAVWATQPQLSDAQLFFCLAAVAVGAMLFAAPYVLDHYFKLLAPRGLPEGAPPSADPQKLAVFEADLRRQLRAGTEAVEQAARANAAFEGSVRRFETRLAPLAEIQKKFEGLAAELREAAVKPAGDAKAPVADTKAFEREVARLREEQAEKFKSADAKLAKLAEAVSALSSHIAQIPAPVAPAPVETRPAEPAAPAAEEVLPPEKKSEPPSSMLAKALATAQSAEESPAVASIIQSRPRRPRKPKAPETPEVSTSPSETPGESAPPADTATLAAPAEESRESWNALAEGKFDEVTARSETATETAPAAVVVEAPPPAPAAEPLVAETDTARAKAAALRADDDEEETSAAPAPVKVEETRDEPAQGELLAGAAETSRKRRSPKPAADASALVARVLIGIGNKPFVRGEGPGLSTTKGVPMEFVEIGKWQWMPPEPAAKPIKLQILKNDEVPADGEPIVLNPGQSLEVSPVFPS